MLAKDATEFYKYSLLADSGKGKLESNRNVDSKGQVQEISVWNKNCSICNWIKDQHGKSLSTFYSCPETLQKAYINLKEEIQRQLKIQAVIWVQLTVLNQIGSERPEKFENLNFDPKETICNDRANKIQTLKRLVLL